MFDCFMRRRDSVSFHVCDVLVLENRHQLTPCTSVSTKLRAAASWNRQRVGDQTPLSARHPLAYLVQSVDWGNEVGIAADGSRASVSSWLAKSDCTYDNPCDIMMVQAPMQIALLIASRAWSSIMCIGSWFLPRWGCCKEPGMPASECHRGIPRPKVLGHFVHRQ